MKIAQTLATRTNRRLAATAKFKTLIALELVAGSSILILLFQPPPTHGGKVRKVETPRRTAYFDVCLRGSQIGNPVCYDDACANARDPAKPIVGIPRNAGCVEFRTSDIEIYSPVDAASYPAPEITVILLVWLNTATWISG